MPDSKLWQKRLILLLLPFALPLLLELGLNAFHLGCPTRFLLRETIDGSPRYVDNPCFGFRFFPRRMSRMGAPINVAVKKNNDTLRIVLLGGSAIQGEPLPECGPAPRLLARLQAANPDHKIEVINAALTGVNSYAVRVIAHDIYALQPDLLLIYTGHNEFISTGGPHQWPAWTRLSVMARGLRMAGWLGVDESPESWSGLRYFSQHETTPGSAGEARVYAGFEYNLNAILKEATAHKVPVLLCTVASNTADEPPFGHVPDKLKQEPVLQQALQQFAAQPEAAVDPESLREIRESYHNEAWVYYLLGHSLWNAEQKTEAVHAWTHARDLDRLRIRGDAHLNHQIRQLAKAYDQVQLLDVERIFNDRAERGTPGSALFDDHVHFSETGNKILAAFLASTIADQLKLNIPPISQAPSLELSPWNQADRIDALIRRRTQPPFSGRMGNLDKLNQLVAERTARNRQPIKLDYWRNQLLEQAESDPFNPVPPAAWGRILTSQGHAEQSIPILQHATKLAPFRADISGLLTLAMALNGQTRQGIDQLVKNLPAYTRMHKASALLQVALELKSQRHFDDALLCLQAAHDQDTDHRIITFQLSAALTRAGKRKQALKLMRTWIRKHPSDGDARDEEAAIFVADDNIPTAEQILRATMKRMPERPETPLRLALLLRVQERRDEELSLLRELVAAHPHWPQGYYELGRSLAHTGQSDQARVLYEQALDCPQSAPLAPAIQAALQRLPVPPSSEAP